MDLIRMVRRGTKKVSRMKEDEGRWRRMKEG